MRVRAGGVPPSCSRTVKQAQAAERAGRAANRLRGAQRERKNFSAHGSFFTMPSVLCTSPSCSKLPQQHDAAIPVLHS
ncbi:hypothetical protein AMECASPLE_029290 [Ameca splendens]|uniref:Uncharacterized protein n=1 Tax=Ameca splendens TaxID=208324 RepID=A0ABV1AD58_9TELE